MTFSLKQRVLDSYQEQGAHSCAHGQKSVRTVKRAHYIIVATGLTWQEAKSRRNQERTLEIVPERAA